MRNSAVNNKEYQKQKRKLALKRYYENHKNEIKAYRQRPEVADRLRLSKKEWAVRNHEKVLSKNRNWRKKNQEKSKSYRLKYTYGISLDDYQQKFLEQKGLCAICKTPPTNRPLFVDHCHKTNKIRGLLCTTCNFALGALDDNITYFIEAIKYLEKYA